MALTVDSFANSMATEAGEDYTDAQVVNIYTQWVKEAYITIAAAARFFWLNGTSTITTKASQATYGLGVSVAEVKTIRNVTTDIPVGYNTEESLARLNIDFEEEGAPRYWFYAGLNASTTEHNIQLVPVPDGEYTLNVRTLHRPSELSSQSIIPLPIEFLELMRFYVRAQYQHHDDKIQLSAQNLQLFQQGLVTYASRYTTPRRAGSRLPIKALEGQNQAPGASTGS
jgi:hypothetical protein